MSSRSKIMMRHSHPPTRNKLRLGGLLRCALMLMALLGAFALASSPARAQQDAEHDALARGAADAATFRPDVAGDDAGRAGVGPPGLLSPRSLLGAPKQHDPAPASAFSDATVLHTREGRLETLYIHDLGDFRHKLSSHFEALKWAQ